MSLKHQKIIRFIPIINMIVLFSWFRLLSRSSYRQRDYAKELFKMFFYFIIITVIRILLLYIVPYEFINNIIFLISAYLYFFSMASVALRAQEKLMRDNDSKK